MIVDVLNRMSQDDAKSELWRCCGCAKWVDAVAEQMPFRDVEHLQSVVRSAFASLHREDWLEAFAAHPKIGDVNALREKFAATSHLCESEQAGVAQADERIIQELADGNRQYEAKFGHIFIVCATGKSAGEMLALLKVRLSNDPATELANAAEEQKKITQLRLEKL